MFIGEGDKTMSVGHFCKGGGMLVVFSCSYGGGAALIGPCRAVRGGVLL